MLKARWPRMSIAWRVLVIQLCLIFCDPLDKGPLGSSVPGILHAIILEWVAIPFSRGAFWSRDWTQVPHIAVRFFYCLSHHCLGFSQPGGKPISVGWHLEHFLVRTRAMVFNLGCTLVSPGESCEVLTPRNRNSDLILLIGAGRVVPVSFPGF